MAIMWSFWNLCRICPGMGCAARFHCHLSQLDRTGVSRLNMLKPGTGQKGQGEKPALHQCQCGRCCQAKYSPRPLEEILLNYG